MTEPLVAGVEAKAAKPTPLLCWICNRNPANSGEHKTKRSDLLAVLGKPTQGQPLYYHDLEKGNRPVQGLDARILKSPVRICAECNSTRTQPHDRAWEQMSDRLRAHRFKIGKLVRANKIFPYDTRRQMKNVHLFFLKLTGCMLCEGKANGYEIPMDIAPFSKAILSERPHPEVHLQFGRCDGTIGRSDLHVWTTQPGGSVLAAWLYELDTIAVSVHFIQAGRFQHRPDLWHPNSHTSSKRFLIANFMYSRRAAKDDDPEDGESGKSMA